MSIKTRRKMKETQDPIEFMKTHKLNREEFESTTKRALTIYEKMKAKAKQEKESEKMTQALRLTANNLMQYLEQELKKAPKKEGKKVQTKESKNPQKEKSKKVVQEAEEAVDELEECKNLIKAQKKKERKEREKKIEAGELKRPPVKTRVTKIKEALIKVLKLLPLTDAKIVASSEDELLKCANALFKLHGMNQFKQVEKGIKEEADSLIEKNNEAVEKEKKIAA